MALVSYIISSSAGTRLAECRPGVLPVLLAGETFVAATPAAVAEHNQRIAGIIAAAKAKAEPDERDIILEALKADLPPAKIAAARAKLSKS